MAKQEYVCTTCWFVWNSKRIIKGSFWIELILWIIFFVPGIIYSIWRLTTRYSGCQKCKSSLIVPADTPKGQKLILENK